MKVSEMDITMLWQWWIGWRYLLMCYLLETFPVFPWSLAPDIAEIIYRLHPDEALWGVWRMQHLSPATLCTPENAANRHFEFRISSGLFIVTWLQCENKLQDDRLFGWFNRIGKMTGVSYSKTEAWTIVWHHTIIHTHIKLPSCQEESTAHPRQLLFYILCHWIRNFV